MFVILNELSELRKNCRMVLPKMNVIGVMSGTSMDGLDLALVTFWHAQGSYQFELVKSVECAFPNELKIRLKHCRALNEVELNLLNIDFGIFIAESINQNFSREEYDLISSHGHTVFHQPEKGITLQIGDIRKISSICESDVVGDFRKYDVQKGGQGAPLVPIGDKLLFSQYEACLNLGGISNVSFDEEGERKAFDVAPFNLVANFFANQLGHDFDKDGSIGSRGEMVTELLQKLDSWSYYSNNKTSLGIEDLEESFFPIFDLYPLSAEDKLCTFYHHVAKKISTSVTGENTLLVSGGGAKNSFFIKLLKDYYLGEVVVPNEDVINFKEAIVFAFLGYLRINEQENILKSYTGASSNSCAGDVVNSNY